MRHLAALAIALVVASPLLAKPGVDLGTPHDCCKDGVPCAWPGYQKGVQWEDSLDAAFARARELHRPLLFHVLVGDMDREGT